MQIIFNHYYVCHSLEQICVRKTKLILLKPIYFHHKTPGKHILGFFEQGWKKVKWKRSTATWGSNFKPKT